MTETTVPVTEVKQTKKSSPKSVSALFSAKWINTNLYFFLYCGLLLIGYIAYGHWTDKTLRNISNTQNQLKDLQYEYKTVKSQVMNISGQEQVVKAAEPLGLKISNTVPKRLQIQKSPTKN